LTKLVRAGATTEALGAVLLALTPAGIACIRCKQKSTFGFV